MTNIAIPIPPSLQAYREHLREFISGMVKKLDKNSYKATPEKKDVHQIVALLLGEVSEFLEQVSVDRTDENSLIETQDIANFALLAFIALRSDGVKTAKERLIDEWLDIDTVTGRVFCKKSRSGCRYKMGAEMPGARHRSGYIYFNLQNARTQGRGLYVPRSHLVWWKATGRWPIGVIDHVNRVKDDDRYENLRDVTFRQNSLNHGKNPKYPPNVTCYNPPNRKGIDAYGKFVYQRQHAGKTTRIAYFDTPEEAATVGYQRWLEKTGATE